MGDLSSAGCTLGNARRGTTWSRLVVKYFGDDALRILGRASSR